VFGSALHLVVSNVEIGSAIRAALERDNIVVARLQPIRPSLEDAFVALTTRRGVNGGVEQSR
jgi:hypothetical protein